MTKRLQVSAFALVLLLSCPLFASIVTLDMTVNDGTSPLSINVGEKVTVKIYGTVTDSNLGLALYAVDILTSGGYLDAVESTTAGQWKVTWGVAEFAVRAKGNTDNAGNDDDVLGHGAGLVDPTDGDMAGIALTRTLLATGEFVGVSPGTTSIAFGDAQANVMWYDGGFKAVAAGTVLTLGGAEVTVVPEPVTLGLLMLGLAALGRRRAVRSSLGRLPRAPRPDHDPAGGGGA